MRNLHSFSSPQRLEKEASAGIGGHRAIHLHKAGEILVHNRYVSSSSSFHSFFLFLFFFLFCFFFLTTFLESWTLNKHQDLWEEESLVARPSPIILSDGTCPFFSSPSFLSHVPPLLSPNRSTQIRIIPQNRNSRRR